MSEKNKIPKILHYCWFGKGKKNKTIIHCMNSWKKYCKDYKFMEWNEETFDINSAPVYVKEAYEAKKYAFVSDYVRLWALYYYGGIYIDTDVEIIKPLDRFLKFQGFSGFSEITYKNYLIPAALMGAKKKHEYIKYLLSYYKKRKFKKGNKHDLKANVFIITEITLKKYPNFKLDNTYQEIKNFVYFPNNYFTPNFKHHNHKPIITKNTYAIHYHNESWMPFIEKSKIKFLKFLSYLGLREPLREIFYKLKNSKK